MFYKFIPVSPEHIQLGGIEPVSYFSFDTLDNVKLYEDQIETNFDALVDGRVKYLLNQYCHSYKDQYIFYVIVNNRMTRCFTELICPRW